MIKILIPQIKGRVKSNIRGFWYSKENKKIYYDYLSIEQDFRDLNNAYDLKCFYGYLDFLKQRYNQETMAYIDNDILRVYYSADKIEVYNHKFCDEITQVFIFALKGNIKRTIKQFGGCIIYKTGSLYFKEVFYR